MEKLAYESAVRSKGYLSDIERGLARPSLMTLQHIAEHLGVALLDLVTFPEEDDRQRLVDASRHLPAGTVRRLLKEVGRAPRAHPPR
jgi:transcriptional regulator with XRE-family HTH domain